MTEKERIAQWREKLMALLAMTDDAESVHEVAQRYLEQGSLHNQGDDPWLSVTAIERLGEEISEALAEVFYNTQKHDGATLQEISSAFVSRGGH